MEIKVKIFDCNWETYKNIYLDVVDSIYKKKNIFIDSKDIIVELENLEGETIQSKRRPRGRHSRTITVFENDVLKYIVGISNTGYDLDKKIEVDTKGGKYEFGNDDFHSNTYLCQGINKIFDYYYEVRKVNVEVKLYFYLLDICDKTYPHNLSNLLNYRKLATIGFEILNLNEINFLGFEKFGFSRREGNEDIKYVSFNKFANDILAISKLNKTNIPAYLKCIDEEFEIGEDVYLESNKKIYVYTFKALGANAYDSFLTMWTLQTLANKEEKKLEFLFASEKHNFRLDKNNIDVKFTTDFPKPIIKLFEKIGLNIKYENSKEVLQQYERELTQFERAKEKNVLRNQELFKNNIRKKGIQTKCYLCNCEIEEILEAAHLWGVSEIQKASEHEINVFSQNESIKKMFEEENYKNTDFYRRYMMANSGDNGIWLCSNHHGLLDSKFYCFDSKNGKILFKDNINQELIDFFKSITVNNSIPEDILTENTKLFLSKNENNFNKKYIKNKYVSMLISRQNP